MVQLSMRTVIFSHAISSAICLLVMILLWHQNQRRFAGVNLWLANSTMQFVAIVLIGLRGRIPDFASIVLGNALIIGGILVLYIGLERFVEKRSSQVHNFILLATFVLVHSFFTFVQPSLLARNINVSLGIFLISCQAVWLLLRRVTVEKRPITRGLGYTACALSVVSLARIPFDLLAPTGNDFLSSNPYDTLIVMSSQMLFVILTFGLILTVNRRLVEELEQDIIHRKQAEETIRASEENYRLLFTNNPAPMLVYDTETLAILAINEFAIDQYGYSREELLSMTIKDIRPPEEIPYLYSVLNTDIGPLRKIEAVTHRKKDGSLIYVDISGHAIEFEGRAARLILALNITERLKAQEALRESEAFSQAVLKNSPIGISVRSHTGKLLSANDAWKKIWAIPNSDVQDDMTRERDTLEFDARDNYLLSHHAEVRRIYEDGGYLHLPELKTTHPRPGAAEWVSQHFYAINNDDNGQVGRVVILTEDISERKLAEEAIHASEEKYRLLFTNNPAPMWVYDTESLAFLAVNDFAIDLYGYSREEFLSMTIRDIRPLEEVPYLYKVLNTDMGSLRKVNSVKHRKKDGTLIYVDISGHKIEFEGHSAMLVLALDITERVQAQEELQYNAELNAALAALYHPLVAKDSTIQNIAHIVLQQALKLTGSEHGYVSEIDLETGDNIGHTLTEMLAGQCEVQGEERRIIFPRNKDGNYIGLWGYALNTKQAFYTNNPVKHPASTGLPEAHIPIDRFLSVPVLLGEKLVGQIALANPPQNYNDRDLESIQRLAEFYALALQRKRVEDALEESEYKHRTMIANISDVVAIMDVNGVIQYKSPNLEKHFGWRPEDLVGTNGWDTVHPDDLERIQDEFFQLLEKKNATKTVEYRYKRKDGDFSLIELTGVNLIHDPRINGILMNYHDITDRKRVENELKSQKSFFEQTFIQSATSTQILDQEGWCLRINPKLSELFGVQPEHIEGHVYNIFKDEEIKRNGIDTILKRVYEERKVEKWEVHFDIGVAADSQNIEVEQKRKVWYANKAYPIVDSSGRLTNVIIQHEDISERKLAEQAVQDALLDKEVLLRELYHRAKNNMQVISSMLNLEIAQSDDESLIKILKDMDNRIRSMALVHQKLYQSQNLSSIDLKDYISDLVNLMIESYQVNPGRINFSLQVQSIPVLIDTAIPCGLIINEILSNALKYAFPRNRKGTVQIRIKRSKNATIVLEISDDGVGVPSDIDLRNSNTLGMQTVFGIARHQLGAKVELETHQGVAWRIHFTDDLYTSRV